MGDYIDKGNSARATLELVRSVAERFPKRVSVLLGNHELNLLIDRSKQPGQPRYLDYAYGVAHPAQYLDWLPPGGRTEETEHALDALQAAVQEAYDDGPQIYSKYQMTPDLGAGSQSIIQRIRPASLQPLVSRELRRWQYAYLRGVSPRSANGAWLQQQVHLIVHRAGTLFVHGGLPPEVAVAGSRLSSLASLHALNAEWHTASVAGLAAAATRPGQTAEEAEAAEAFAPLHYWLTCLASWSTVGCTLRGGADAIGSTQSQRRSTCRGSPLGTRPGTASGFAARASYSPSTRR